MAKEKPQTVTLTIQVMPVADGFVALCAPGDVRVRGSLYPNATGAVADLLRVLGNGNGDSDIALALAIAGTTLGEASGEVDGPALGAGESEKQPDDGPPLGVE